MHRYGTLDEQAQPLLFLASDAANYITGTILPVAGGEDREPESKRAASSSPVGDSA